MGYVGEGKSRQLALRSWIPMSCERTVYDMRPDFTSITIYIFADPFHKKSRFIHSVANRVYGVSFEQGGGGKGPWHGGY